MAFQGIRGAGINLQTGNAGASFGGAVVLAAGESQLIPSGSWNVISGPYTFIEYYDPIPNIWRTVTGSPGGNGFTQLQSDGVNYRLINRTGCPIGARVTTVGSAYTSSPTVSASAGASTWKAWVGGAISQTVTVTAAGTYNYTPSLYIPPPIGGGVQATAICALSGTAINTVTVIDQGANYPVAPPIYIIQDPRDTATGGGVLTTTLTGSGVVTAVTLVNQGTPLSAVPTLSFTGGGGSSAAASVLLVATATGITLSGATNQGNGSFALIPGSGVAPSQGAVINPSMDVGLFQPRLGYTASITTASPTALTIVDGGLGQYWNGVTITPVEVYNSNGTISGATTLSTNTFGGVSDRSLLIPA